MSDDVQTLIDGACREAAVRFNHLPAGARSLAAIAQYVTEAVGVPVVVVPYWHPTMGTKLYAYPVPHLPAVPRDPKERT